MEQKTPLYGDHEALGARIVPFAGFLMPLEYSGIISEHRAVRERAGIFDLSHMGEFRVTGGDSLSAIDALVTNDVEHLEERQVRYTPMCYESGGIVDDLLVYRYPDHLMLVVNASNIDKDLAWIREHLKGDVQVENVSREMALIAVQGPQSETVLQGLTSVELPSVMYYHFTVGQVAGVSATISRTGYTGEDGFELYVDPADASQLWEAILAAGSEAGVLPVGLGARDTLRLEAGYMLYGNDIDQHTSPIEAGLGWTVKFGDHDFIGRDVLERQKTEGTARRLVAIEMQDKRIPRPHFAVRSNGEVIGELTSGTYSPTLNRGIALAYVQTPKAKVGTDVDVDIRDRSYPAKVVRKPVYKR